MGISVFDSEPLRWTVFKEKDPEKAKSICDRIYRHQLECARQRAERGFSDDDVYDIGHWFLTLIPEMLQQYKEKRQASPGCLGENYTNADGVLVNDTCHAEWDEILDRMIFLFRECREDTCSRKNPYESEHSAAFAEFDEKYGLLGEKLRTPEEIAENERAGGTTAHFMSELPEYREIDKLYSAAEDELNAYMEQCRLEAMELFTKWMPRLWD